MITVEHVFEPNGLRVFLQLSMHSMISLYSTCSSLWYNQQTSMVHMSNKCRFAPKVSPQIQAKTATVIIRQLPEQIMVLALRYVDSCDINGIWQTNMDMENIGKPPLLIGKSPVNGYR